MKLEPTDRSSAALPFDKLGAGSVPERNAPESLLHNDLRNISALSRLLLAGESLNDFNRKIFTLIAERADELTGAEEEACWELRDWFLFAVKSQNFRSPSHERENAVYQGGIIEVSKFVKYLRSEINTPFMGEEYDRNTVLIRSAARESFAGLCSRYTVFAPEKTYRQCPSMGSLPDFLSKDENQGCMVLVEVESEHASQILEEMTGFLSSQAASGFKSGLYLRFDGSLDPAVREGLKKVFALSGSQMQIVLEEAFDPFGTGSTDMRRVTFIQDQTDPARYQLIQDAASMGYRPSIDDVVRYYFDAGRLEKILNTRLKTEDSIVVNHREEPVQDRDLDERNRDYAALLGTIKAAGDALGEVKSSTPFAERIFKETSEEVLSVEADLRAVLADPSVSVSNVAEIFHRSYYRARTLVQYAARLSEPPNVEGLEEITGAWENGKVLSTNSGMTAVRVPLEVLKDAEEVHATDGYWESAFLTENSFGDNPHYRNFSDTGRSKLRMIPHTASPEVLEQVAEAIAEANKRCPHGQLIRADASISPFFYTHSFDLKGLAADLAKHADEFVNPVYLIVDNTLDFDTVNAQTLFPEGIPRNLFLIFTMSHAKLHQLGFDAVTGGMIEIHANEDQNTEAEVLRELFRQRLDAEGSRQNPYALELLNETFFSHYKQGTMPEYLGYMIGKRRRNTRAMIERIAGVLGPFAEKPEEGVYNVLDPRSKAQQIKLRDAEDREHQVEVSFHFDPLSCIHAYLKILEPPTTTNYVAGRLFEEIRRRVFKLAAAEGIHVGDGTSWGFTVSRMDWYMHTMRLATGLEHRQNLAALGTIFGSVLKEFLLYPDDFLKRVEVAPMTRELAESRQEELLALDRLIPQAHPAPIDCYLEEHPGREEYSFIVENQGRMASMLLAYLKDSERGRYVYLSKTATAPGYRGQGYFRRMSEHLRERAAANGIERIVLQTSASLKNKDVVKAYEKCGFEVRAVRCNFDGEWPLLLVEMEAPTSVGGPVESHFEPVPDEVYEEMHSSRSLEAIEEFCAERGLHLVQERRDFSRVDLGGMLSPYAGRAVPHYIVNPNLYPFSQVERDLHESLMERLFSAPETVVLASARSEWAYVYILKPEEELPFCRAGVIFTQIEGEAPVPGGYWMDAWEQGHGISKSSYSGLSLEQRAACEAGLQLQYVLDQYWGRYFIFWCPSAYEQWRSSEGENAGPIELQPVLARRLALAAAGAR